MIAAIKGSRYAQGNMQHEYVSEQELTALCAELVAIPSVNGVHDERAVAEHIADWANVHRLWADVCGDDTVRPVVVVTPPS